MAVETCGVHPMIREAGAEYLFNQSEADIPRCKIACFHPELIPCSQEKTDFLDVFSRTSLYSKKSSLVSGNIFADIGLFEEVFQWTMDVYIKKICQYLSPQERQGMKVKLHPQSYANTRQFEKAGFQVLFTNEALEDICSESATCYAFGSSALYRLPLLVGSSTICLNSGSDKWCLVEDILRKMGVPFR